MARAYGADAVRYYLLASFGFAGGANFQENIMREMVSQQDLRAHAIAKLRIGITQTDS